MAWCLIPKLADEFKANLVSGKINPEKLNEMTSEERHKFFADMLGEENAKNTNALFESKLLLKNQQRGMINWAKQIAGIKPEVKRDIITKIQRMDKILTPENEKLFLNDLVNKRLGIDVTLDEARNLSKFSKVIEDVKGKVDAKGANTEYGAAKVAMQNYINDLKSGNKKWEKNPVKLFAKAVEEIAGTAKFTKASLDNSGLFRQGWKALWTNPMIWSKNAILSFKDLAKGFTSKETMNGIKAEILGRKNAMNGYYEKMKLAVGTQEEAFPTMLPEKIPILGRLFRASETAYTGFLYRTRADIADKMINIAEKTGVDLDKAELGSIGKMINSLTGRGGLGSLEPAAKHFNYFFFSPKLMASHFQVLTHPFTGAGGSNFVRKQSAKNLLKIISGTATVLAIAKTLKPDSVETDPRSADFGKIKIGNTRFDVTGGASSIATLAARSLYAIQGKEAIKSSTSGKLQKIGTGFGQTRGQDLFFDFLNNKTSPVVSVIEDLMNKVDRNGNPITPLGELGNLFTPLPITTYQELKANPDSADTLVSMIADGLGINVNTYAPKANYKKLEQQSSKPNTLDDINSATTNRLKEQIGENKYHEADKYYQDQVKSNVNEVMRDPSYKDMSDDEKKKQIQHAIKTAMQDTLDNYDYEKPDRAESLDYIK